MNHKLFTSFRSYSRRLWQQRCTLHQRPFTPTNTPETFYTRSLFLHLVFTRFLFHQKTLTSETFHKTLYTKSFGTLENFHKGNLLQQRLNKALHRTTLVLEALYAKEFALQKAFTQTPFTANIFCTRNRFIKTGKLFIFFSQGTFVPKMFGSYARSTLH